MLRVAMISPLPPEEFGESKYTAELIRCLAATDKVEVVAVTGREAADLEAPGGRTKTLPVWNQRDLKYPATLLRHLKRERPHVVHIQFGPYRKLFGGLFGEVMLFLLLLLRLCGFKTSVTLHSTWMPYQVKERVREYRFLSRFSILAPSFFRLYMKLLDWGSRTIQLSTVREGSALRKRFLKEYGIKPDKILEIPHPFQHEVRIEDVKRARTILNLDGKRPVLLFGFIRRGKGLDVALLAMRKLVQDVPDAFLLIAGKPTDIKGSTYLGELKKLCVDLSIEDNVRFDVGFVPEERVPYYVSAASVLLIPYTESVGASGPIHSFAAYGVPIVASDEGHHMPEALGGNLVLFRAGSSEDLSLKLKSALSDPSMTKELAERQISYASRETWEVAGTRTLQNYRITLGGKR